MHYMQALFDKISLPQYCEQNASWSYFEPYNYLTNVVFFIAAIFAFKLLQKRSDLPKELKIFPYLIFIIGINSSFWHSFRSPLTLILDALPIFIIFGLIIFCILKLLTRSNQKAWISMIAFIVFEICISAFIPETYLNGSLRHLLIIFLLLGIAAWVYSKHKAAAKTGILALSIYIFAVIMRTIDPVTCEFLPMGTHFLWHILNALGAYVAVVFLIKLFDSSKIEKP